MGEKGRLWMKWRMMIWIISLVLIQTEAYGTSWNWELFLRDVDCDFYYDPDTVIRSPENIVRVWWKEVFKTKEVMKSRGFTRSEYEKAAYQINVTEINCKKKSVVGNSLCFVLRKERLFFALSIGGNWMNGFL